MEKIKAAHEYMNIDSQFREIGYQVFRGCYDTWLRDIRRPFEDYILRELEIFQGRRTIKSLEEYHEAYDEKNSKDHHLFISKISRKLPNNIIDLNSEYLKLLKTQASNLVKKELKIFNNTVEFRVVRPNSFDNNNLHRDHWFPYFYPLINIYLPISGSDFRSVLKIIPKSHYWKDKDVLPTFNYGEGKKTTTNEGIKFSTPNIKYCKHEIIEHRPDVLMGDFMLFSPLCIHGGGTNSGGKTRFSFEIRLEISSD